MEYCRYIARQRARFSADGKQVNIPYGSVLEVTNGFLAWKGWLLCTPTSQTAHDYFSQDDDGQGLQRGKLVTAILKRLNKRGDEAHQVRWDKVWADPLCQKYRMAEYEDFWIWNHDFYNAPLFDLQHIAGLIGAKV